MVTTTAAAGRLSRLDVLTLDQPARLIVNPAALKLKRERVQPLLDALVRAIAARRAQ